MQIEIRDDETFFLADILSHKIDDRRGIMANIKALHGETGLTEEDMGIPILERIIADLGFGPKKIGGN